MGNWTGWRGVLRTNEDPRHIGFWCPGCEHLHVYDERWKFDGNYEKPTFTPSLRTSSGHYCQGSRRMPDGRCAICVQAEARGVPSICGMCHLTITKGKIEFHSDSTHRMKGTTVAMVARDET